MFCELLIIHFAKCDRQPKSLKTCTSNTKHYKGVSPGELSFCALFKAFSPVNLSPESCIIQTGGATVPLYELKLVVRFVGLVFISSAEREVDSFSFNLGRKTTHLSVK